MRDETPPASMTRLGFIQLCSFIQTVLMLTNSRIPCTLSSRPNPEFFTPPNGRRGSDATIPLINTAPASRCSIQYCCSSGSFVHAALASPNGVSFASSTASSILLTRNNNATGPNNSSQYAGEFLGISVITVGG